MDVGDAAASASPESGELAAGRVATVLIARADADAASPG